MLHIRLISSVIGLLLCMLALAMLLPALIDLADGNADWQVFLASAVATCFAGGLMFAVGTSRETVQLGVRDVFILTTGCWLALNAFAAIPFIGIGLDYSDAFFEAMSGTTTTGSTVIVGLDKLPRGLLLWRALLQWIGGIGIIVMGMVLLPRLRVGGMQLFQSESSERSEKVLARSVDTAAAIASVYMALSISCMVVFMVLGMTPFDAVCHAMATVSTGGFSTHDSSFAFFASPALERAAIVFMILGALPFFVLIRALRGQPGAIWVDAQVRTFIVFIAVTTAIGTMLLVATSERTFGDAALAVAFNVVSVVTTTGFASEDYTLWGTWSVVLFFCLTFVGGCAGSTSGAIKTYRWSVAQMITRSYLIGLLSPNRVVRLTYNGRHIQDDVPFSVMAFFAVYISTVGAAAMALGIMGLDLDTAVSAAATAVGNVGPGVGSVVGPAGNFAALPDGAKWVLSFAMLLGRLELFTVLVILLPDFWRG